MKSYNKPILLIFAFVGLLWACETTAPFVNDIQLALLTEDYDEALAVAQEAIDQDPSNSIAHYYKGIVLANKAYFGFEDPAERTPFYGEARESLDTAKQLMETEENRPSEYDEIDDEVTQFWAEEFNSGVNVLNDDSLFNATPEPYQTALAHFNNAAAIQPDSAVTYQAMSSTWYNAGDPDKAIEAYETAISLTPSPQYDDYDFIIALYLTNEDYDGAVRWSETAREAYPDSTQFIQYQADAYLQTDRQEEAIALVEGLIEQDPENPQYRRVLSTQVYQLVSYISDDVSDLYNQHLDLNQEARRLQGDERDAVQQQISTIESEITQKETEMEELVQISIREMKKVVEMEPNDESANSLLGIYYQNRAANLFERRNIILDDDDEVMNLDRQARENLEEALIYYERAAEINPDNPENWQSLFQVYTNLGMEEEAAEAMEKAGY